MLRKIIKIDEEKCIGCGACAEACHEGAIEMVDGKARLAREDYCDGLGDCLPSCPADAISFEVREAPAYDEAAVLAEKEKEASQTLACGCPGTQAKILRREDSTPVPFAKVEDVRQPAAVMTAAPGQQAAGSQLQQWPVQIKLVPTKAPYYENANLLIAADCTAYACGSFHQDFIRGRITLIGCPKLDSVDYSEKLTSIIRDNNIKSVTIVRMEVPCCGGLEYAVKQALRASGKFIPWQVVTISTDGRILE